MIEQAKGYAFEAEKGGRRFAVGDVHGCAKTLRALVSDRLRLQKRDALVLLGDLINRGPDSKGVIDFVMELRQEGYRVHCLRGNHEDLLLASYRDYQRATGDEKHQRLSLFGRLLRFDKAYGMTEPGSGELRAQYLDFFESLPHYLTTEGYLLVHAGFDFTDADPFAEAKKMMWSVPKGADFVRTDGRAVLCGHVVHQLHQIEAAIDENKAVIPLDNGCVFAIKNRGRHAGEAVGSLCAFDLDSRELHAQPCLDEPRTRNSRNTHPKPTE